MIRHASLPSRWRVSIAALALAAGCARSDGGAPAPSAASPAPSGSAPARAASAAAASPPPAPPSFEDAGLAAACGTKPLPDCPLQAWMKAKASPPAVQKDAPALAEAFDEMTALAPPDYTNWASIAKDGAAAARAGDTTAARAACRSCHDQYKAKYKAELRARKI
jgi:hypothetical protein